MAISSSPSGVGGQPRREHVVLALSPADGPCLKGDQYPAWRSGSAHTLPAPELAQLVLVQWLGGKNGVAIQRHGERVCGPEGLADQSAQQEPRTQQGCRLWKRGRLKEERVAAQQHTRGIEPSAQRFSCERCPGWVRRLRLLPPPGHR